MLLRFQQCEEILTFVYAEISWNRIRNTKCHTINVKWPKSEWALSILCELESMTITTTNNTHTHTISSVSNLENGFYFAFSLAEHNVHFIDPFGTKHSMTRRNQADEQNYKTGKCEQMHAYLIHRNLKSHACLCVCFLSATICYLLDVKFKWMMTIIKYLTAIFRIWNGQ